MTEAAFFDSSVDNTEAQWLIRKAAETLKEALDSIALYVILLQEEKMRTRLDILERFQAVVIRSVQSGNEARALRYLAAMRKVEKLLRGEKEKLSARLTDKILQ